MYKYDVRACFHRIKTPAWMHKYFCMRPVRASLFGLGKGFVYPALTTLPMGFTHAPHIAQSIHEEVLRKAGLRDEDRLCAANDRSIDRARFGMYIDDGFGFSPDRDEAIECYETATQALGNVGLSVKIEKSVVPTLAPVKILGLRVEGGKTRFAPPQEEVQQLVAFTRKVLNQGKASGKTLERIIGKWAWFLLSSRLGFSVFSAVYGFIKAAGKRILPLWPSVRKDLLLVCGIAPLLSVDWRQKWSDTASAFDASRVAQGVSETVVSRSYAKSLLSLWKKSPSVPEERAALEKESGRLKDFAWKHVVSSRFRYGNDIDKLEAAACLTAVRRAVNGDRIATRFLMFGDNSPVVAALNKGRCSSFRLLVSIRRIAAVCLASGTRPLVIWVPSKDNPADEPSRAF